MAVRLPSDLIVDVMRNAVPSRREAAIAKLQSMGTTAEPTFANAVGKGMLLTEAAPSGTSTHGTAAYRGFEQMVLRNLFETLLPSEESGTFGGGPSAGIWRSMAADHLAEAYGNSGGVGIEKILESSNKQEGPRRESGWPYFSMDGIELLRG